MQWHKTLVLMMITQNRSVLSPITNDLQKAADCPGAKPQWYLLKVFFAFSVNQFIKADPSPLILVFVVCILTGTFHQCPFAIGQNNVSVIIVRKG